METKPELEISVPEMLQTISRLTSQVLELRRQRDELLNLCERALSESARVHPDFYKQLQTAIAKARG